MAEKELERLFITLLADDSNLEREYTRILTRSRQVATEVSRAFEAGASKGFVDSSAKVERAARSQKAALDPVKVALEAVKNETASLRHDVENLEVSQDDAIRRFKELRTEALAQAGAFDKTSKEYRQFTQVGAQASRSIATLEGRVSKLGFSGNAAVGITHALRTNVEFLGPAGNSAANALGIAQIAIGGFLRQGNESIGVLARMVRGFQQLSFVMPLLAAGATIGAIAALVRLGTAAAETADAIDKGSQSAGLSAEAYQELRYAFDQNGISAERFDLAVQSLNRRLGLAAQGNATYAKEYERLGIAIRDAHGSVRDTEDVLTDAIDAISRLPNAAEQAASASVLFGDDVGKKLLPALKQGKAGIEDLRDVARDLGLVISGDAVLSLVKYKDTMATLQQQFNTAKVEIVAGFIPLMTDFLIPLLQNTLVPALQGAAEKVTNFAQKLIDTGPAGVEFRAQMLANIQPLLSFGDVVIGIGQGFLGFVNLVLGGAAGIGAALGTMSVQVQEFASRMASLTEGLAWWQQGNLLGAIEVFRRAKNLAVDVFDPNAITSSFDQAADAYLDRAYNLSVEAQERLARGLSGDYSDAFAALTAGIADAVTQGAGVLPGVLEDVGTTGITLEPPPPGSLAALRAELQAAQKDFETAVTEEARLAALDRVRVKEAEINAITALMNPEDPLRAARIWTQRLAAEYETGLKSARDVFDLIFPRLEELREEARTALVDFGFDSAEYQAVVGKIQLIESLLGKVRSEVETPLAIEVQAGIETRTLTAPNVTAEILAKPVADVAFLIHQYASDASDDLQGFRSDYDDWAANVAITNASLASAFHAPTDALNIFTDTLKAMIASGASLTDLENAVRNSPFFAQGMIMGFPGGTSDAPDVGLLQAALDEQRDAYAAVQAAMTEDQLREAGARLTAANEEVERLREIYATAADAPVIDALTIREDLASRLNTASAAAEAFGTSNQLAAEKMKLLEDAIRRILELDPAADVTDLVVQWEALGAGADAATQAMLQQENVTRSLAAAQAELDALAGNLPDKYEQLRIAFVAAAAAGKITVEQLQDFLRIIRELEDAAGAAGAVAEWAEAFDIAGDISRGLTEALEGIASGDVTGVLGGLTAVGAAIGTALGGPAVGALIQSIGGFLQTLPSLFQAISDLFTGDSPARRELARTLASTVAGAFKSGILDGLKGGEDWQANLREGVTDAVLGAVIDAFIQAAILEAIFAPFIEEFTRILNKSGADAAFAFFDREFEGFLDEAVNVAEEFVGRARRFYSDTGNVNDVTSTTGTVELPTATVAVLAAPQWTREFETTVQVMGEAASTMLEAAQLMQATFQAGVTVQTTSGRGIDAQRATA